jgi:hypothetical protein
MSIELATACPPVVPCAVTYEDGTSVIVEPAALGALFVSAKLAAVETPETLAVTV